MNEPKFRSEEEIEALRAELVRVKGLLKSRNELLFSFKNRALKEQMYPNGNDALGFIYDAIDKISKTE